MYGMHVLESNSVYVVDYNYMHIILKLKESMLIMIYALAILRITCSMWQASAIRARTQPYLPATSMQHVMNVPHGSENGLL